MGTFSIIVGKREQANLVVGTEDFPIQDAVAVNRNIQLISKTCAYQRRTVRSWLSRAQVFTPIENVSRRIMSMLMSLENKVGRIRDIYLKSL